MQYKTSTLKKLNKVENSTSHPLLIKSFFILSLLCFFGLASKMSSAILPNLQPSSTTSSGGGNVTSVSSGDGCIFVSPTTGDVVITFNTSCGSGGGAVDSVSESGQYIIVDPETGNVVVSFNETTLNRTISNLGVALGFNSTFNSTYAQFAYNQTDAVFTMTLLNNTIAQYGVLIGFNSTFNQTYNNILNQTCPVGNYTYAIQSNGTILCRSDVSGNADFTNVAFLNNTQTFTANQTINANLTVMDLLLTKSLSVGNNTFPAINVGTFGSVAFNGIFRSDSLVTQAGFIIERNADNCVIGCGIFLGRSRGNSNTPTIVNNSDAISSIISAGYDGTNYEMATMIRSEVDGQPANNFMPGRIMFYTSNGTGLNLIGYFNSSGQMVIADELYVKANQAVSPWLYNQTSAVFSMLLLNETIANYGVAVGFNSTFNSTYNNLLNQMCPVGTVVNGTLSNGTLRCDPVVTALTTTTPDCLSLSASTGDIQIDIVDGCTGVGEVNVNPPYLNQNQNFGIINITFNETFLNNTISNLGVRVGFNDTRNPFNQTLNTTSNVTFANITARNVAVQNLTWKFGYADGQQFIDTELNAPWYTFTVLDGLVQAAYLTNIAGSFAFLGGATLPMYFISNGGSSSIIVENDATGRITVEATNGLLVRNVSDYPILEANSTMTRIYNNLGLNGTRIFGACPLGNEGCVGNLTGWNLTFNHQRYDITSTTSLDTIYLNNQSKVIYIDVTFQSAILATGDSAYITFNSNTTTVCSAEGIEYYGGNDIGDAQREKHHLGCSVQPNTNWTLVSNVQGNGAVSLEEVFFTIE